MNWCQSQILRCQRSEKKESESCKYNRLRCQPHILCCQGWESKGMWTVSCELVSVAASALPEIGEKDTGSCDL